MPLTRCLLDGASVRSLGDLYDALQHQLSLPPHFGRNLDALWDVLATEVEGPLEVVWKNAALSRAAMGGDFERAADLLREVAAERDDVTVRFA